MISVTEAAQRLGVSPSRVRVLIRKGRLEAMFVAGVYVLDESEVERFAQIPRKSGRPWHV